MVTWNTNCYYLLHSLKIVIRNKKVEHLLKTTKAAIRQTEVTTFASRTRMMPQRDIISLKQTVIFTTNTGINTIT